MGYYMNEKAEQARQELNGENYAIDNLAERIKREFSGNPHAQAEALRAAQQAVDREAQLLLDQKRLEAAELLHTALQRAGVPRGSIGSKDVYLRIKREIESRTGVRL